MFVKGKNNQVLWQSKDAKNDSTGYEHPSEHSPEHCANCEHFKRPNGCAGKHMKEDSNRPRLPNGNVKVSPFAWCKFWTKRKA